VLVLMICADDCDDSVGGCVDDSVDVDLFTADDVVVMTVLMIALMILRVC
jgi:hypothetical protein